MSEIEHIKQVLSRHGYKYLDVIGEGSFSSVILCQCTKYNHLFAIKRVLKKNLADHEIRALISLIHPYVVKLYVTFDDEDYRYLVMEYCPNGTLKEKGPISYDKFVFYAKQLLEVLDYCHSQKIAHRDIKPDNIFLDQYDHVKLGDFGFADEFNNQKLTNEKCGSLIYSAPEMFSNQGFDPFKTDIWALGISFFYIATGFYPYPNCSSDELRDLISLGQLDFSNVQMDTKIKTLIMKMTSINPLFRPSAHKLLKLPLFTPTVPSKLSKKPLQTSSILFNKSRISPPMTFYQNPIVASFSGEPDKEDEGPKSENNLKLSQVRSFKSYNIFTNVHKPSCQRFVKYD